MDIMRPLLADEPDSKRQRTDMAPNSSGAPPSYEQTSSTSTFALLSFHTFDRVRLTQMSQSDVERIRDCVAANWQPGVQHCKPYNASTELKLRGHPWGEKAASGPKEVKLVLAVLSEVHQLGWAIEQSVLMCKKAAQKDTILLRRVSQPRRSSSWFAISFDHAHILTIHGGPDNVRQSLISRFGAIQPTEYAEYAFMEDRLEVRMKKQCWLAQGEDTIRVRLILLQMAEVLDSFGFKIHASLRLGTTNDALFCMREDVGVTDSMTN